MARFGLVYHVLNYPGLGDPNTATRSGSVPFHFDVNCNGIIADPNDLTRLGLIIADPNTAACRTALTGCP